MRDIIHKETMAKVCTICDKGKMVAGKYSNRVRATKFNPTGNPRKYPNLQWAALSNGTRMKICTRCMRAEKHLPTKIK